MKRTILFVLMTIAVYTVQAQDQAGKIQKKITDSICNCISKVNFDNLNTKEDAEEAFTNCFSTHALASLIELAEEKKLDITDEVAMRNLGIEIGKDLIKYNCTGFTRLSMLMANKKTVSVETAYTTTGTLRRIETRDFNYFILLDDEKKEVSYIWLRNFPGSENFITNPASMAGRKVTINWKEIEVYLPKAKGYYKVKEVTGIEASAK